MKSSIEELEQLVKAAIMLGGSGLSAKSFKGTNNWINIKSLIKPYLTKREWKTNKKECKNLCVNEAEIVRELLLRGITFKNSLKLITFVYELSIYSTYDISEVSSKIVEVLYNYDR